MSSIMTSCFRKIQQTTLGWKQAKNSDKITSLMLNITSWLTFLIQPNTFIYEIPFTRRLRNLNYFWERTTLKRMKMWRENQRNSWRTSLIYQMMNITVQRTVSVYATLIFKSFISKIWVQILPQLDMSWLFLVLRIWCSIKLN